MIMPFDTQMALTRHVFTVHKCPYHSCHYSNMFEAQLEKHVLVHNQDRRREHCVICLESGMDLKTHKEIHPPCASCQLRMINLAALRAHEQTCGIVANRTVRGRTPNKDEGYSLNLGATNIESGLSENLNKYYIQVI